MSIRLEAARDHGNHLTERGYAARGPALPRSPRLAIVTMYTGVVFSVVAMVVPVIEQVTKQGLSRHLQEVYPSYSLSALVVASVVVYLVTIEVVGIVAWLWMTWAVRRRKRWAPAAATVILVLACGVALVNLTVQEYGRTVLPTDLGLIGLLPCFAGLVAVVLLWRRNRRESHRRRASRPGPRLAR
jgi:hypothetical protein